MDENWSKCKVRVQSEWMTPVFSLVTTIYGSNEKIKCDIILHIIII